MSYISWNCRGLGKPRTVRALGDMLRDQKPIFLFLIETISVASKIEELRIKFGFDYCFSVDRVGRSGGLAVLWKRIAQCQVDSYSSHHINMLFMNGSTVSWRLSCYYGYPERTRRRESWSLIRRLANISAVPWCIWGDFNDLMVASDKKGQLAHPQYLLDGFCNVIEECQLSEIKLKGGKFTWERGRNTNAWVREKLDRGFASERWLMKFPAHNLKVMHAPVSDHEPIVLEVLSTEVSKKEFRFRFENIWLKEPNFVQEVSEIWSSMSVTHLLPKIIQITSFMARWGRSFFHKFREKIRKHKANLERLVDCTDEDSVQEYLSEREKLNTLLLQEEIYWQQRAKLFWLREGDDNTRFFHASASAKRKANRICFLNNDEGERIESQEGMCDIVRDYFTKLFTEAESTTEMANATSHRRISMEQNVMLTEEFNFEEFTTAVKQMHPDKAGGPDGLNPAFFQSFWKVMGQEVFNQCREWLQNREFPGGLNSTNMVLIC